MTESLFLVAVGFGFGFVSGMLVGTLIIGWLAWRAVKGLATLGGRIRDAQQRAPGGGSDFHRDA